MDAIEQILDFGLNLRFSELPQSVVDRAKMAILDTIGATIAGADAEGVRELTSLVLTWGGRPESTLLPDKEKVPVPWAALVNGSSARALDLDDVHEQATCHVNATPVPALLAVAEARKPVSGEDFLTALVVASEIICRMALAPRISFSVTGMANSYQCGIFGAALGSSRILRLTKKRALNAMGIAHAFVCGNQQGYLSGTQTVRIMQGVAAHHGVMAALMAEKGITGSHEVLEGKFGYYPVFHRNKYERGELIEKLGVEWRFEDISIKPVYPCCKFTHGPIEAAMAAMKKAGCSIEEVEKIEVAVTNKEVYDLVCIPKDRKWNPQTLVDAQFSLPYTVATAAVHGNISLPHFNHEAIKDSAVINVMKRVETILDVENQGEGRGNFPMPGVVSIHTRTGEIFEGRVDYVKGHPKNPMSFEDVAEKFRVCAGYGVPDWHQTNGFIEAVQKIEACSDVSHLIALLND